MASLLAGGGTCAARFACITWPYVLLQTLTAVRPFVIEDSLFNVDASPDVAVCIWDPNICQELDDYTVA